MTAYDRQFFANHHAGAESSARVVVPLLRELVRFTSVADVGCGTGAWLSVFAQSGTTDYHGFDGAWAEKAGLLIASDKFSPVDLANPPSLPRRFDLALSLEVAEHLPEASADRFVEFLTALAPVVVFSAAIPRQGGTDHVNEQWPDHWAAKFDQRGFACIDALRPRLWADPRVQWWYAQNTLIFADRARLAEQPALAVLAPAPGFTPPRLVHPECLALAANKPISFGTIARETPKALRRAVLRRLRPHE